MAVQSQQVLGSNPKQQLLGGRRGRGAQVAARFAGRLGELARRNGQQRLVATAHDSHDIDGQAAAVQ